MIIKGSDLMLFVQPTAGTFKSIGYATNHTLTIGTTSSEVSTKDSGGGLWNEAVVQKLNWSATTENLFALTAAGATYDDLFDVMTKRETINIQFTLESSYQTKPSTVPAGGWSPIATPSYKGKAYITDLQKNAPDGDNASFTATFTGIGALEKA